MKPYRDADCLGQSLLTNLSKRHVCRPSLPVLGPVLVLVVGRDRQQVGVGVGVVLVHQERLDRVQQVRSHRECRVQIHLGPLRDVNMAAIILR